MVSVPGRSAVRLDEWKNGKRKTVFQLTFELDLDTLMPGERKLGDEAVLYNRFYAPADGTEKELTALPHYDHPADQD